MSQPDSDDGRTDPNFLFVSFSPFLTFFGSLRSGWVVVVTPLLSLPQTRSSRTIRASTAVRI